MKKTICFMLLLLLSLACAENSGGFHGLGVLNIGTNFTDLPDAKAFRKVMDGEFYTDRFHLSDAIGTVSDLNVSTHEGKICEVKFSNTEQTDMNQLRNEISHLVEADLDPESLGMPFPKGEALKLYHTQDENILIYRDRAPGQAV